MHRALAPPTALAADARVSGLDGSTRYVSEQPRLGSDLPVPRWSSARTSPSSRNRMKIGKRVPRAAAMPEAPGPPARYTIGAPGEAAVERKRTKRSVTVFDFGF